MPATGKAGCAWKPEPLSRFATSSRKASSGGGRRLPLLRISRDLGEVPREKALSRAVLGSDRHEEDLVRPGSGDGDVEHVGLVEMAHRLRMALRIDGEREEHQVPLLTWNP
jgi:hypothetical protein